MQDKQLNHKRTLLLAFSESSLEEESQSLKGHDLGNFAPTQNVRSEQDYNYEFNNESNENLNDQPMQAVQQWDIERQQFRNNYRRKVSNRKRLSKSKSQKQRDEIMDIVSFKRDTNNCFIDQHKLDKQVTTKVDGIDVYFPYEPYNIQLKYIQKVLDCLRQGENGLLQSPTGTGKTLSLLCGILSWLKVQKEMGRNRRVIYLSRTHTQLFQVIKELKSTCFRPTMVHVASRDHACIKKQLKQLKGRQKMEACSKAVKMKLKFQRGEFNIAKMKEDQKANLRQNMCNFYKDKNQSVTLGTIVYANRVMDLEQMRAAGQTRHFCPYYYPFHMQPYIDVFFMPYNYILDADLLPRYKDMISGSILVFDEAHNVAEAACEGRSYELFSTNIKGAEGELIKILYQHGHSQGLELIKTAHTNMVNELLNFLKDLQSTITQFLNSLSFEDSPDERKKLYMRQNDRSHIKIVQSKQTEIGIYELFSGVISNPQQFQKNHEKSKWQIIELYKKTELTCQMIDELIQKLKETEDGIFHNLQKVATFTRKAMALMMDSSTKSSDWFNTETNHFRLMLQVELSQTKIGEFDSYKIQLRCLVPWLTFDQIQSYSPKSIIFTSGTMSPLESWQDELKIKAPVQLVNGHVISKSQIALNVLKKSVGNLPLNFTHRMMQENFKLVYSELALTVIDISKRVPNGILVVCPNFRMVSELQRTLHLSSFKNKINKSLIFEQRGNENYVDKFKRESQKGAILICVCRGRASEGIDFPDNNCRAVVLVGVPFPNLTDPILIEKKEHYTKLEIEARCNLQIPRLSWNSWYFNGTIRAVSQALGRVIRHKRDYGMLFLLDERYQENKFLFKLPRWASESVTVWHNWDERRIDEVAGFFSQNQALFPVAPKVEIQDWLEENYMVKANSLNDTRKTRSDDKSIEGSNPRKMVKTSQFGKGQLKLSQFWSNN